MYREAVKKKKKKQTESEAQETREEKSKKMKNKKKKLEKRTYRVRSIDEPRCARLKIDMIIPASKQSTA